MKNVPIGKLNSFETKGVTVSREVLKDISFMILNNKRTLKGKEKITYEQWCQYKKLTKLQRIKASEFIEGWPK